jgi:hypothetical protein
MHLKISQQLIAMSTYLSDRFDVVRRRTEDICGPLEKEDYVVQPVADVSPPKCHLAHTTWFFETFLLKMIVVPGVGQLSMV